MNAGVPSAPLPSPASPVPRAGAHRLRPRYSECDPMGVVHHAAYLIWLELGRTELLRAAGVSYAQLEAAGVFLVVARIQLRYKRPARYDEMLEIRTTVARTTRATIDHEYEVVRTADTEVLLTGTSTIACVDGTGRVRELPAWLMTSD